MEQMKMNKNMTSTGATVQPINEDMRIELIQKKLGNMGPPVLRRNCNEISEAAATARLITGGEIGRTSRRIGATKTIQAFIRRNRQTSTRRVFLSHMERRNRHLDSLKSLESQMALIKNQLEMEKQVMRTTFKIFNQYPKPGE